jgi:hypothetical protein
MEQDNVELEQSTADDDGLLDHHIEEILGALADAARKREVDPDAESPPVGP